MLRLALVVSLVAVPALAQATPVLRITGMARVSAPADRVDVHVMIATDSLQLEVAAKEDTARFEALTAVAKDAGIEVQLSGVSFTAQDELDRDNRPRGTRYRLYKQYVLSLRAIDRLDALLIAVAKTGAKVAQIELVSERLGALNDQLIADAAENARKRAEQTAAAAGVRLGKTLSVSPRIAGPQTIPMFISQGGGAMRGSGSVSATYFVDLEIELLDAKTGETPRS